MNDMNDMNDITVSVGRDDDGMVVAKYRGSFTFNPSQHSDSGSLGSIIDSELGSLQAQLKAKIDDLLI